MVMTTDPSFGRQFTAKLFHLGAVVWCWGGREMNHKTSESSSLRVNNTGVILKFQSYLESE